jgi:hypothetical protein
LQSQNLLIEVDTLTVLMTALSLVELLVPGSGGVASEMDIALAWGISTGVLTGVTGIGVADTLAIIAAGIVGGKFFLWRKNLDSETVLPLQISQ